MPNATSLLIILLVVLALGLGSLLAWAFLASRWLVQGVVLAYQPRRPVPWGVWATLLAILLLLGSLLAAFARGPQDDKGPDPAQLQNRVTRMAAALAFEIGIVAVFLVAAVVLSNATGRDIGLPSTFGQAIGDVFIGVVACLASYAPVFVVRIITVLMTGEAEEHPMIKIVRADPNLGVLTMATIAAVIVAPLCEELSFRLLLQGWLEKWEDKLLGWRRAAMPNEISGDATLIPTTAAPASENPFAAPPEILLTEIPTSNTADCEAELPPRIGLAGLPHGSIPILISSALFALAHLSNSVADTVPLFVLAFFLGFIYQRTHRILPSLAAHAMFNLVSMLLLWQLVLG